MARTVRDPDLSAKLVSKAAEFDALKDTPHLKQPSDIAWLRDIEEADDRQRGSFASNVQQGPRSGR